MKLDNFVLLIISIVTLIVISLLTECNRGRLTELENKATKEIVETFFHLGSADPTEPGQKGYLITRITEGKYGGRSRQEVLDSIGGHNTGDYISDTEKDAYGSGLFDSNISGREKNPVPCTPPLRMDPTQDDDVYCEDICVDNKLTYKYTDYVPAEYGGKCDGIENIIMDDNGTYKYITDANESAYATRCLKTDGGYNIRNNSSLLQITANTDNTITIVEPTWCGFFSSEEVSNILFPSYDSGNKLDDRKTITYAELQTLKDNQKGIYDTIIGGSSTNLITNSLARNYKYNKPDPDPNVHNGDYYNVDDSLITIERDFIGHSSNVYGVFVSGDYLFTGSYDNTAKMWDISTGSEVRTFSGHSHWVLSVFVSGDYLFTGSRDNTAKMWDISTGNEVRTFSGHSNRVRSVFVSGDYLFTGSSDNTAKMWDISTGNEVRTFTGHSRSVYSVFVSGDYLFTGSSDDTAKMWDISTGNEVRTFSGHSSYVHSVFVSGDYLFTGSDGDNTAKMWDISTGNEVRTFSGHSSHVYSVFVSGDYLFTGSWDNTAKMWDISTGNEVRTFSGHSIGVSSVFVSGDYLFTGSYDNTAKMSLIPEFKTFTITHQSPIVV